MLALKSWTLKVHCGFAIKDIFYVMELNDGINLRGGKGRGTPYGDGCHLAQWHSAPVYMKRIEWSIRSKTRADWDFRINPVVFLYSIYMKRIEILSIRSTSNLKSILKSSRLTWVLRSDQLENVRAASCKHVKRIEDIDTRDYFLKTHACFTEKQVFNRIDRSILSM